jgi:hypothetical protein
VRKGVDAPPDAESDGEDALFADSILEHPHVSRRASRTKLVTVEVVSDGGAAYHTDHQSLGGSAISCAGVMSSGPLRLLLTYFSTFSIGQLVIFGCGTPSRWVIC